MSRPDIPLCVQCVHCMAGGDYGMRACRAIVTNHDPVHGTLYYQRCAEARGDEGRCGPAGLLFRRRQGPSTHDVVVAVLCVCILAPWVAATARTFGLGVSSVGLLVGVISAVSGWLVMRRR